MPSRALAFFKDPRLAPPLTFDIVDRAAAGRIGRFTTAHGAVTTPTLLPVINPNIDLVSAHEMRRFGCEMVITNSYVIHKHKRLREAALRHGVGSVIGWDGPVMTDSGTFQMYVYGDVEVGPEDIVRFQADMGVDVATCLDLFVTPDMSRAEAEQAVATTIERTRRSADTLAAHRTGLASQARAAAATGAAGSRTPMAGAAGRGTDASRTDAGGAAGAESGLETSRSGGPGHAGTVLNTTVQGGIFPDLRQHCAAAYRDIEAGYTTIGGVVPLMERQMYPELVEAILHSQAQLRKDRPVHLFGAGHPLVFPLATALGCDVFDSSSYAKYAKDGRIMTPESTLHVEDLAEWPFSSRFLDPWMPAELAKALQGKRGGRVSQDAPDALETRVRQARIDEREASDPAFAAERAIALHNLDVCFADIRRIREAIRQGVLWELVEQRATAHPLLAAATRKLGDPVYQHWLEAREPLSAVKALRYTGGLTHRRPVFGRIQDRMVTRFTPLGDSMEAPPDSPYADPGQQVREAAMHKEPAGKPFSAGVPGPFDVDQDHVVISALGPTPLGLDEAYPFAQSVLPRLDGLDRGHMAWVGQAKDAWLEAHALVPGIPGPGLPGEGLDIDMLLVLRTADWQFGVGAGAVLTGLLAPDTVRRILEAPVPAPSGTVPASRGAADQAPSAWLPSRSPPQQASAMPPASPAAAHQASAAVFEAGPSRARGIPDAGISSAALVGPGASSAATARPSAKAPTASSVLAAACAAIADALPRPLQAPRLRCQRSKATGKMRTVHLDDQHILSLRAHDGLFTLKPAGAKLLRAALPSMRVTVHDDSVPFNRQGKSVFAQFVKACDPQLRPGDECLVVDGEDHLVALGQLLLAPDEILDFDRGMAVKVRDGVAAAE